MALIFASGDRIVIPTGQTIFNETAFTVLCWFRISSAESNEDSLFIYGDSAAFNKDIQFFLSDVAGQGTDGEIRASFRTPTATASITSASQWNDDLWHWGMWVRRASNDFELYIDGSSEGTSSADPGVLSGETPTIFWGEDALQPGTGPWLGSLARGMVFKAALTVDQGRSAAYKARWATPPEHWTEMFDASVAPDWSGNGVALSITGTPTVSDHAPVAPPFAFDLDWQGAFTAPGELSIPVAMHDYRRLRT